MRALHLPLLERRQVETLNDIVNEEDWIARLQPRAEMPRKELSLSLD